MSDFHYHAENDPEAFEDDTPERNPFLEELEAMQDDPHYFDFSPGYATEMDYMNAQEADDYTHEFDDIDF